ncbi:MAG: cyclic pyranopterin monophosphate synthase MoaC [Cyanobacteria bacterium P01_D01_bin.156]
MSGLKKNGFSKHSSFLSHLNDDGDAHMVDVSTKAVTQRVAIAEGYLRMDLCTLQAIQAGNIPKGDVLGTARIAGIMAAKQTANLIPLCHPLAIKTVEIDFDVDDTHPGYRVQAMVKTTGQTGVEMEALTAVSVAALTLYDMAKALQKSMHIEGIRLISKFGGESGDYTVEK